jgi:hypothetical protein
MPDYIERDAAIKMIEEDLPEVVYYQKADAIDCLTCLPSADVVPSSEVDKWKNINEQLYREMSERIVEERKIEGRLTAKKIFNEIEKPLNEWIELYYQISVSTFDSIEQAKAVASESVLRAFRDYTTGLRNKYVEDKYELT